MVSPILSFPLACYNVGCQDVFFKILKIGAFGFDYLKLKSVFSI